MKTLQLNLPKFAYVLVNFYQLLIIDNLGMSVRTVVLRKDRTNNTKHNLLKVVISYDLLTILLLSNWSEIFYFREAKPRFG